jgi:branched-subunit amino acid transport protein
MPDFAVLLAVGVGTYLMRAAFLLTANARPPDVLSRYLPYVAPAVLAAITVPMLAAPRGTVSLPETLPALAAAAATWVLWRRTEKLPTSLLGGLGVWWGLTAVVGTLATV